MNHIDLTPWTSALWLCEPDRLQRAVVRARTHGRCYTREEILAAHRESLEMAKGLADGAVEGTGETDAAELAYEYNHPLPMHLENKLEAPRAIRAVKGKVGVIPIYGMIAQRMSSELMKAEGTSTDFIGAALDALVANPGVGAIVLRIDSPGGTTHGIQEISDKIYNARGKKPIIAMADSMAASAGYWVASAADMIVATPGGEVGSVGVYRMHVDESALLEKEGVKVSLISAGKYKTEFAPIGPLSDDARAEMQARVNETYDTFLTALKRNRGQSMEKIRNDYGQGRVLSARSALEKGVVDRVLTFESLMAKLTGSGESSPVQTTQQAAVQASAEVLLARHKARQRRTAAKIL